MCRWLAYSGSPIRLDELLYKPQHSLIDQSLHAEFGRETTNGDGFGVGWYPGAGEPGVFHGIGPAWSNDNLRSVCEHISAPLVLAHIRSATGSAVQQTNCHPFQHGRWLWMHNGSIARFQTLKRDLTFAVDPSLYPYIRGSTDSETMFYLALTFGLEDDPPAAVERMVGFVEKVARDHGVDNVMQMTVATCDGVSVWAFRYSTVKRSRSLFYSTSVETLREMYPNIPVLRIVSSTSRLVVSEPLVDLPGAWNMLPESTYCVIAGGEDMMAAFRPRRP